jgi:hypothetical protein
MKKKRVRLGLALGVLALYAIATGGGFVVIRRDSLASSGLVAKVDLTDGASVYLKQTPTTRTLPIPLLIYYVRETYPFRLRFYGSTRDGSITVSDRPFDGAETNVVVTEVTYYREPDAFSEAEKIEGFRVQSWKDIVIPEPGNWKVHSRGYVRYPDGHREELTFPTMTIRPTQRGQVEVVRFISYLLSGMVA